jgi:cytoskeletal protein RodZ
VSAHGGKELPIPTKTKLKLREYLSDKSELTENSLTSLHHVVIMFNSKSVKYVALSGFLGLFATMLGALGDIQNQAFAQITPTSEKYGGSSSDQSSSSNPSSADDESGGGTNPDPSGSSSSNDDNEGQGTSVEEEETIEDESMDSDSDEKNPLLEQIIDQVKHDFAAAGMSSLDW